MTKIGFVKLYMFFDMNLIATRLQFSHKSQ